jgi:hypothetical protein
MEPTCEEQSSDYASLQGAKVTDEQPADTRSLRGATTPNG